MAQSRGELEADASGAEHRRQQRALRAAEQQQARVTRARATLADLAAEKQQRAKRHAKA
jgi:hypothetical protein